MMALGVMVGEGERVRACAVCVHCGGGLVWVGGGWRMRAHTLFG